MQEVAVRGTSLKHDFKAIPAASCLGTPGLMLSLLSGSQCFLVCVVRETKFIPQFCNISINRAQGEII